MIKKEDIEAFWDYITPSFTSIITDKEEITLTPTKEKFLQAVITNNKSHNCYSPFRKIRGRRLTKNVTFLKNFVVDIDEDEKGEKAKIFEEYCKTNNLAIGAKVFSGGGWHYYIPISPTIINDKNRDKFIKISAAFCQHLLDNNIEVDKRTFDLPRLIRVWGTYNFNKNKLCELIYLNKVSEEQLNKNTSFFLSLKPLIPSLPTPDSIITSCILFQYLTHHKLDKQNTEKNNILLRNLSIYLRELMGDDGYNLGVYITKLQGKKEGEFRGWWKRKDLKGLSCGEMIKWLKKYYPELLAKTCSKCRIQNRNKISYTDGNETWHQLKKIAREKNVLLVNKEVFIKGRVEPYLTPHKESIAVIQTFEYEKGGEILFRRRFFDEPKIPLSTKYKLVEEINVDFYCYNLIEEGTNYLLLSEREIKLGDNYIEGSSLLLKDNVLIGNYGKIESKRKVIICHTAKSLLTEIRDVNHLFKLFVYTKQELLNFLYYHKFEDRTYQEPEFLNDIFLAFLFSGKKSYPLHLLICGPQGCGKSSILEAITDKFDESAIESGSITSIKGLIPSFGSKIPQLGRLLSSKRICRIDEFFGSIKDEKDAENLRYMNEILECRERDFSSGKGKIVNALMKAKFFGVTNPIEKTTFEETINKIPETSIARIFIINLVDDMTKWVNDKKNKHYISGNHSTIDKYCWLSIYDFLTSFLCEYDEGRVERIVEDAEVKVPQFMRRIYKTRYSNHHCYLLFDGIVKTRCMFERDKSFKAKDEDYEKFEKLWNQIIDGWNSQVSTLTNEQELLLEIIGEGISEEGLRKECERRKMNYKYNLKVLKNFNLVEIVDGEIRKVVEEEMEFEDLDI